MLISSKFSGGGGKEQDIHPVCVWTQACAMMHVVAEERAQGAGVAGGTRTAQEISCRRFSSKLQLFLLLCSILKVETFLSGGLLGSKYNED